MHKKIFCTCLFLISLCSFSQEIVSSVSLELKKNHTIFQVVNNEKKDVTLFVNDKIGVKAIQLNETMKIVDSVSAERPNTKIYDMMIGYNISNNNTRLFWASNDYQEIFTQLYDISNHKVETKQYNLSLKEEQVLEKFSGNNNFYILSVLKKGNKLKLHVFDKDGTYAEKILDLNGFNFLKSDNVKSDLYGILKESLMPLESSFSIKSIDTKNPVSLVYSAKKKKCYFNEKQIVITLDTNIDHTQVFTIDLEKFSITEKIIKQHLITGERSYQSSNSFYFENKLYQLRTSMDQFYFSIKDLDGKLLKEYDANSRKEIDFKNSKMTVRGSDFGGKRTLETTSQFIYKINDAYLGISCYNLGQNTLITFGGVSPEQQSSGQFVMNQFGFVGALIGALAFSPSMNSFNTYQNRKLTKFESLFDNNGNHIDGEIPLLAFDKIGTFFEENKNVSAQTLYKIDSAYYLGYYDTKAKEYTIRKFVD